MRRSLAILVFVLVVSAISQYALADPTSVSLAITPSSGQLVGTYKFSIAFSDTLPDNYDVLASYKLASEDASKYKSLFGITRITNPIFTKSGNTLSADLQLVNYMTGSILTTYDFKVSAGTDLATKIVPDIESVSKQVTFTSRCTRRNPVIVMEPSSYAFNVPYGQTLTDTKEFTVSVKNMDDASCGTSLFTIMIGTPSGGTISASHNRPGGIYVAPGTTDSSTKLALKATNLPKGSRGADITFTNDNAVKEEGRTYSGSATAIFTVTEGVKPCEPNPPQVDITSHSPVFPGFTIEYTATIQNMDGSTCDSSTFKFDSLRDIPIGWQFSMDQKTVGIDIGGSGTLKFNVKSMPTSNPTSYSMTICFTNVQTGKSNCGTNELRGGGFFYTIKPLTGTDNVKPNLQVSLSPENPYPNIPATFSVTTSDNEQMKSVELFVGVVSEKQWALKDPETTVMTYQKTFSQGKYGYYAIATDYNSNQARFPEIGLQQIDVKDRPDLTIKSIVSPLIKPGDTVTIAVNAANTGTVDAGNVNVRLVIPELSFSEDKTISLPKGQTQSVTFENVKFGEAGDYTLKSEIDPDNAIEEASEKNNELVQKTSVSSEPLPFDARTCVGVKTRSDGKIIESKCEASCTIGYDDKTSVIEQLFGTPVCKTQGKKCCVKLSESVQTVPLDVSKCIGEKIRLDGKKIQLACESQCSVGYDDKTSVIEQLFGTPVCKTQGKKCCAKLS